LYGYEQSINSAKVPTSVFTEQSSLQYAPIGDKLVDFKEWVDIFSSIEYKYPNCHESTKEAIALLIQNQYSEISKSIAEVEVANTYRAKTLSTAPTLSIAQTQAPVKPNAPKLVSAC
jgi:hypothetical protein